LVRILCAVALSRSESLLTPEQDRRARIMTPDDIAPDLPPGGSAGPSLAPMTWARRPQRRRGHGQKIAAAVEALRPEGLLPPDLRPFMRDRRIWDWLLTHGYAEDMPSRQAIARFFEKVDT
jgi:hypothetical protein